MSLACVDVVLFGEFSLTYKGNKLAEKDYRSQKMWAVLAYLIMNRKRPVTQAELVQQFWDDEEGINPASALKTLVFRLRKLLLPLIGDSCQPITSTLGAYQWNTELPCKVDVDEFEDLLLKCEREEMSPAERAEYYRKALSLYRGDFLPKAIDMTWHTIRSSYYHMQYSKAAFEFAELLESQGLHDEMTKVCSQTLHMGVLEEKMYVMLIKGLLHQGNHTLALQQYEKATDVLYNELGVERSSDLKALYQEIMNESMQEEPDIEAVLGDIQAEREPGAFFCEYGFFKEAYRMEERRAARTGTGAYLVLITLTPADGLEFSVATQTRAMKQLREALRTSLRQVDVVAQYSARQFVVLLPTAEYDDCIRICQRIESRFHGNRRFRTAQMHYSVRAVMAVGEGEMR